MHQIINKLVIGQKKFLEPLFYNSIVISKSFYTDERKRDYHNLTNNSDFLFVMEDSDSGEKIELLPQSTIVLRFDAVRDSRNMVVRNFLVEPEESLEVVLKVE